MQNFILRRLKGTDDIIPDQTYEWINLENCSRKIFAAYHYKEIRTPVIEETGLFVRSVGTSTEIVQKQMYTFEDRGGKSISLRPEGTAPVVRAYLENRLGLDSFVVKLFYIQSMFRGERPQAGRNRQFHQIGAEAIGSHNPLLDAEIIALNCSLLESFDIQGFTIKLNSIGCEDDKKKYSETLLGELISKQELLCSDCRIRLNQNPLRILDCKIQSCKEIVSHLPSPLSVQCKQCRIHYEELKKTLDALGIKYEQDPHMVRGLDYYTKTAFEIVHPGLSGQDAISAGGRYDNLVEKLGGNPTGCCGFAIGIERVLLLREKLKIISKPEIKPLTFIATMGQEAGIRGLLLAQSIRKHSIPVTMDYKSKSLKSQMRYANKINAQWVIIIGEEEVRNNQISLKSMKDGSQQVLSFDIEQIVKRII